MKISKEMTVIGYVKSGVITTIVVTEDKIASHSRLVSTKEQSVDSDIMLFVDLVNRWKKKN